MFLVFLFDPYIWPIFVFYISFYLYTLLLFFLLSKYICLSTVLTHCYTHLLIHWLYCVIFFIREGCKKVLHLHFIFIIAIAFCTLHLFILLFCIASFIFVELKHTIPCVLEAKWKLMINGRLGHWLVIDDEIATQQRMHIWSNFGSGSKVASNFGERAAWVDKEEENDRAEREPDRGVKGSGEQKG